jgi:hypothetical protein
MLIQATNVTVSKPITLAYDEEVETLGREIMNYAEGLHNRGH